MIDYMSIGEAAKRRVETLQRLEAALVNAPAALAAATQALATLQEIHTAFKAVDDEGKRLLPEELSRSISGLSLNILRNTIASELRVPGHPPVRSGLAVIAAYAAQGG